MLIISRVYNFIVDAILLILFVAAVTAVSVAAGAGVWFGLLAAYRFFS